MHPDVTRATDVADLGREATSTAAERIATTEKSRASSRRNANAGSKKIKHSEKHGEEILTKIVCDGPKQ
jgi:hypothetical protein